MGFSWAMLVSGRVKIVPQKKVVVFFVEGLIATKQEGVGWWAGGGCSPNSVWWFQRCLGGIFTLKFREMIQF